MWRKVPISEFGSDMNGQQGDVMFDTNYFYLYTSGQWRRVVLASLKSTAISCLEEPSPAGYPPEGVPSLASALTS